MIKNRIYILVLIAVLAVVAVLFFTVFRYQKPVVVDPNLTPVVVNKDIEIFSPKPNELISSPLKITGMVRGNGWTGFEGQVGIVKLFDSTGKELGMGILTATEDWMKLPTNFETNIYFDYPGDGTGQLVFHNENASGEPARDKTFSVPVKLQKSSSEKTTVKVYFNGVGGGATCTTDSYVQRDIPKTEAVAKAAVEELLKGPSAKERLAGFATSINDGVTLNDVTIKNGVATADFSDQLQKDVAGSCRVMAIRSQIEQTLKQFPTIKSVVISINGKTQDILQP